MGSKLSGTQLVKLEALKDARKKWDRVRKLIETAAVTPSSQGDLLRQCQRTSSEVGRFLLNAGFGAVANYANDLAMLIRRTTTLQSKLGAMRDLVAQGYGGLDRAERAIEKDAD
jgi:hypothetical protein